MKWAADNPSAFIVAISGLITVVFGVAGSRSGTRNERRQQEIANALQTKSQNHDVYRDMVTDLERQVDRCRSEAEHASDDLRREREDHRAVVAQLREIITTLRSVVQSEIATTLADGGIDAANKDDEDCDERER